MTIANIMFFFIASSFDKNLLFVEASLAVRSQTALPATAARIDSV
jgi:hypothetical protein